MKNKNRNRDFITSFSIEKDASIYSREFGFQYFTKSKKNRTSKIVNSTRATYFDIESFTTLHFPNRK